MTDAAEFNAMMMREERLLPELEPYVSEGNWGPMLQHPLVYAVFAFNPERAAIQNESYRMKKRLVDEALEKRDWSRYIYMHERPYRLDAMLTAVSNGADVHDLIGGVWVDSENIHQNLRLWMRLWGKVTDRSRVMSEEENAALAALPATIDVYRGWHKPGSAHGLSWTLDRERADWFAHRLADLHNTKPVVTAGKVNRERVLAHYTERGEAEIVVFPVDVLSKKNCTVP